MKRFVSALICLLMLLAGLALAEETGPVLTDRGTEMSCGSVHYPVVEGMQDPEKQERVNALLLETGRVTEITDRWVMLLSGTLQANLHWRAETDALAGDIVSCVFSADGALTDNRTSYRNTAAVIDLTTGERVTLADLFTDVDAARETIGEYIRYDVVPELNAYLITADLTELPENWSVDCQGITFWYEGQDFTLLSDRAGSIRVPWSALTELIITGEGSVLRRIGAEAALLGDDSAAERIAACVTEGTLPGIPAALGDSVQTLTDTHRLLNDPDLMAGGRLFALEDSRFRNVWIVTDSLTESWDNSQVQGIRSNEYSLFGLVTGVSTRDEALTLLGEPFITLALDADTAESQCLTTGTSDYYVYGEHRLRLHFDEDGILRTVWVS